MKKTLAILLAALTLTACVTSTEYPVMSDPVETRPEMERYDISDNVSVIVPEEHVATVFPGFTSVFFAEEDISDYQGEGLYFFNQFDVKIETSLDTEIMFMESFYQDVEQTEVEIGGRSFAKVTYVSEYGPYNGEDYLLDLGNNKVLYVSLGFRYDEMEHANNKALLMEMLESLEIN